MRFSFSPTNIALSSEEDEAMVDAEVRQALLADQLGFDMVKFGERHFSGYGVANPLQLLAALAPRLEHAWVGTGITVAAAHHPVRLAEMINVLDHVSKGRAIVGIGSGQSTADSLAFGWDAVDQKGKMLAECLDNLEALWAKKAEDPPVAITSSFYRGTLLERIVPSPYRKARPHLKISASNEAAIERAARQGWPIYLGSGSAENERPKFEQYKSALAQAGHSETTVDHCLGWTSGLTLALHIADTDVQAQEEARWLVGGFSEWLWRKLATDDAAERAQGLAANASGLRPGEVPSDRAALEKIVVAGSPETIARRVGEFAELGIGLFQVAFVGQTDPERRALGENALRLFAETILPQFQTPAPRPTHAAAPHVA
jgi:limonene 1,2-monooxygenase